MLSFLGFGVTCFVAILGGRWLLKMNTNREFNEKLRIWGSFFILSLYVVTVIQVNRWAPYSYIALPVTITWFVGLVLYDHQQYEWRMRRQSARVMNFALNYGMSPGRLMSMSGSGELRPDPHPSTVTPIAWDAEGEMWVATNPEASTVEPTTIGGSSIRFSKTKTIRLAKPVRVSRYERIADPLKWVI